jgi:hypothetical protein
LPPSRFTIHQLQQILSQNFVAKQIGQSGNRLFQRADPLHDLCALTHEMSKLLMRGFDHFLYMMFAIAAQRSTYSVVGFAILHNCLQIAPCAEPAFADLSCGVVRKPARHCSRKR